MKVTKKILSIVLVLLLAVSAVSGLAISASGATAPKSATLNIYKGAVDQVDSGTDKTKDQILDDGETYTDQVIGNIPGLTGTPSDEPTGFKPLQGAIFEIYYQGPLGTAVPTTPDTSEAALKKTVVTGESGLATFTASDDEYTTGDGPTGLYYVKEVFTGTGDGGRPLTASSSITTLSAPFFVYLPMTAQADASGNNGTISGDVQSAGERWLTSVSVYPKNLITLGGATLTKTINGKYFSAPADNADAQVLTSEELALLEENPGFILYRKAENAGEEDTDISEEIFIENANTSRNKITDSTYSAAKIFMKGGKIAVDGLPAGTYVFKETTQAV